MKYFKAYELVDPVTYAQMGEDALTLFNPELLTALVNVRDFFGVALVINNWHRGGPFRWRGLRTVEQCIKNGAPHSEHRYEPDHLVNAVDFDVTGVTAESARQKILADIDNPLLSFITRLEGGVRWVHMDGKVLVEPDKRIHVFTARRK
jgi:hypothetical protein